MSHYALQFGTKSGEYQFGLQDLGINKRHQMTFLVRFLSPNTTYYFRIKAVNGCSPGQWSNEVSAKTLRRGRRANASMSRPTETRSSHLRSSVTSDKNLSCQTHIVKKGETLSSIAQKYLGNPFRFQEIVQQNLDRYPSLKNSTMIDIGWEIKINLQKSITRTTTQERQ